MRAVPTILLAAAVSGCAALHAPEAVDTMRLAPGFAAPAAPPRDATVTLAPVDARGLPAGRRYVYVLASDPLVLRQAATLFWEVPPAETIDRALADALRTRLSQAPGAPVTGRLSARLLRFEEASGAGRADAVVSLDATLADAAHATSSTARYCRAMRIEGGGSGARAAAFQASVAAVALSIATDAAAGRLSASGC